MKESLHAHTLRLSFKPTVTSITYLASLLFLIFASSCASVSGTNAESRNLAGGLLCLFVAMRSTAVSSNWLTLSSVEPMLSSNSLFEMSGSDNSSIIVALVRLAIFEDRR